jgi:predicted nucleic acid-binding Zn finger protein
MTIVEWRVASFEDCVEISGLEAATAQRERFRKRRKEWEKIKHILLERYSTPWLA